ncbi:universal stress protein [Streptomyces kunmingensis]|uniref:Universal stress protein n=1 Tax=Streptomyces kunmingensis TaxID=68225 RepID=A0ABU6CDK1_9ACTN|nr:universal stress protein [Streptomyces kunmingensis]MEB3962222.1 universal stress protein [Streptomyces kunmingensis]
MSTPHPLPVVAAVDGSDDSKRALRWALAEAARRDADLRIVHVRQYAPHLQPAVLVAGPDEPADDPVIGDVRKELEGREGPPPLEFISREGVPAAVVPEMSNEAQLLVLGSRGRGGFASLLLGSNGVAAARDAACPVVVVPPPGRAVHGDVPVKGGPRVVVGLQTDDRDETVLGFAFEHAARTGARLQVVAAYPWPTLAWSAFGDFTPTTVDQEAAERETVRLATEVVADRRKSHPKVEVDLYVAPGDAAGHLVANSREAELVVVGRHRRRFTRPAPILGSVTQAVLLHAASPVAVVPPAREEEG